MFKKYIFSKKELTFSEKTIVSTTLILLLSCPYFLIGKFQESRLSAEFLITSLDNFIPLVPFSIWYYLGGLYLSIFIVLFLLKDRKNFYLSILSALSTGLFCCLVFYFFPVPYPRPQFDSMGMIHANENLNVIYGLFDTMSLKMLTNIYLLDSSINTFPSLHVAYCFIFFIALIPEYPRLSWLFGLNFVLIYITTLTTKQHFIADGVAGVIVSLFFYFLWKNILYKRN